MFEEDFIMREIQKMVQVLQVIIGLKKQKKYDEALEAIHESYKQFFEENEINQSNNVGELEKLCKKYGEFSPDLAFALADIINEEAEILEQEGEVKKAKQKFNLAMGLYKRALSDEHAAVPIDVATRMQHFKKKAG